MEKLGGPKTGFWKKNSKKLGRRTKIGKHYEENEENILAGAHAYTTIKSLYCWQRAARAGCR
jgi:hypothetical protein